MTIPSASPPAGPPLRVQPQVPRQPAFDLPPQLLDDPNDRPLQKAGRPFILETAPSWLVSVVVHFIAVLILALITVRQPTTGTAVLLTASRDEPARLEDLLDEKTELHIRQAALSEQPNSVLQFAGDATEAAQPPALAVDVSGTTTLEPVLDFSEQTAPKSDLLAAVGGAVGEALRGRGALERPKMLATFGGTQASEAAVAAALKWLAEHQNADGSWSFDHRTGPCNGRCADPGTLRNCQSGATAMALLCFLGAGHTHREGQYKEQVDKGLYFLKGQMKIRKQRRLESGDLGQGGEAAYMYAHGLASIALCEAYAMTQDVTLQRPAQLALNFIAHSQDPASGGWRYFPYPMPGDTSVLGWQLMALKSGHMAYLNVDPRTIQGASRFLDSVQYGDGAFYGYTGPEVVPRESTTAIGLLCRMYLGWNKEHPALQRGIEFLSSRGPSTPVVRGENEPYIDMYYNYYATQVMRHYCGDPEEPGHEMWVRWNQSMRDWLVATQEKSGHQAGSWHVRNERHGRPGGRLYCTALATMILEVYYRHLPIYSKQAATEEFPL